jgi:hypothetical protein
VPSGLTASFNPATVTSGSQSALTLAVSSTVQTGNYALTVVGTGSSVSHTYPISVTVTQATTGAKLQASPSSFNFTPAQTVNTASAPFVFSLVNSGGSALTISSLTASAQFVPSFQNGQGLPITLQPNGGYVNMQVVFIPTSAGEQTGTIKLFNTTNSSPLTISLSGTGVAAPVTTGNIQINATLNGSPWPGELTYAYNLTGSQSFTGDSSPLTYYNVVPGAYVLAYLGTTSGGASFTGITPSATQTLTAGATITYTLNFTGTNSFVTGNPNPLSATIGVGSNATFQVSPSITSGGQQSVNLSATGVPAGANVSFSNNPVSICSGCGTQSSTVTIATSPSTPPGVYSVVITGTNQYGLASQAHPFSLAINLPPTSAIQLVSKSSAGVEGNAFSGAFFSNTNLVSSAVSSNGRFVAFDSAATNLISNDTNSQPDIFVRDLQAGTTTRVSVASNGTQTDLDSSAPSISADGRYVSFTSEASNLTAVSTQGQNGIYLHDTTSGLTTRVDLAPNGTPANATSSSSSISADGRFIAFSSGATNLMPSAANGGVFVWDTKAGQMLLASISNDGTTSGQGSSPLISADGRFVAFTSNSASLVTGDTNGRADLFVHDFITGTTTRANVASDGTQDNCGIAFTVSTAMSADGRYLSFISCGSTLAPGFTNPNGYTSAYIHDMITGVTTPLATTPQGVILSAGNVGTISADGRFAAYNTYLVDRTTGSSTSLNVATGGTPGNGTSGTVSTSLDGSNLVFSSISSNLVTGDSNSATDVFLFPNPFVASPRVTSLTLAQSTAAGGATIAGSIVLSGPAPVGGATVAVSSNHSAAQIPATVFVPAGMSSAPISFGTSLVQSETVITAVASYNGGSPIALLTLEPSGQIAVSPTTWDFGYQAVGTSSAAESFALTNSGTAALTINSVQLTSGQVFSISANTCGSSIVAGGSCSISVTFKPSASGSASDAVQISYGSPATIQSISLTGNGATPLAALSPVPLSFGNQAMPGSTTAVATLSNSGNASLTNISISIYGTNAGDFAISSDGCSGEILPANSNCQVSIVFTPKSKGSRQATLSIADSASGSPQTISLTGTGVQSTPTLLWNPSAASITYGTPLGTGVLDATANQSGSNLSGTFAYTATITGGTPQAVTPTTVLGAGAYTLTATFTPTDTTNYTTATATTSITVNGIAPTITFTVPNHAYGDAPFTVSATSNSSGAITYSVVSGPATISGSTVTLTGAATVVLQASEAAAGNYTAGTQTATFIVAGQAPTITFTVSNHTYGDAPFTVSATSNSSGAMTYSVVSGPASISGSTVTLTGAGSVVLQASQVAAGNYTAGTQTATVTVAKESQTITFTTLTSPVTYGVSPIALSASASSGLTMAFSVLSGPGTISGSTLTIIGAGTVVVAANQAGNANYAAAMQVTQSIVVNVIGASTTPTFSPVAGVYTSAQTVSISDLTSGATIYYTTNGTTPTTSSSVYTRAIPVASTETLEAIATATGYSTSAVATAVYTISIPTNPVPAISGVSPAFTNAGGAVFTLTVNGSGFIASSMVYWGASALTTTYVSATQLTAQVPSADTAAAGTNAITVQNPAPGGGTSNAWQFEVDSASSGSTAPTITSTTETVAAGSTASYPVTMPSAVTSVSVTCLNLPTGASCSYSSTTNTVTIATSSTTPKGTYQIIVVFTETVSGAASGFILLPILLLPLGFMRRKLAARGIWLTACLGLVLMATAALSIGCGGGSSGGSSSTTPPATHQVTSSGAVSLTIQ